MFIIGPSHDSCL
jgi:hypothetical protein